MKDKILAALRLKYNKLGFSEKAINGVLAYLEKTVTAEDQIDASVEAVEGMLTAFQSEIDGRVQTAVAKAKLPTDPPTPPADPAKPTDPPTPPPADTPEWAKGFMTQIQTLTSEVTALKAGKSADTRKQQLETTLKDAPEAFQNTIMKAFGRMAFDKDEDFTAYLEEVKTDSATFVQSEANRGLGGQGRPFVPAGGDKKEASKEEVQAIFGKPKS